MNEITTTDGARTNATLGDNPGSEIVAYRDPLTFDLDDKKFVQVAKRWIRDSQAHFNKKDGLNLKERRAKNEEHYFGKTVDALEKDGKLADYSARTSDNILYEAEAYLKPIALSRMPDFIVKPGSESEDRKKNAEKLSKVITDDMKSKDRRKILGLGFKHLPIYFTAVIKAVWNPEKGPHGDYDFVNVHPDNIVVDHTAASNDQGAMTFIAEQVEYSVKEWVMRFPLKEQEFYKKLRATGVFQESTDNGGKNEGGEKGMNTKVKGWEIWFTWYEKVKGTEGELTEYEPILGVAWFYEDLVFKKIKNPNWDWTGEDLAFSHGEPLNTDELQASLLTGAPMDIQTEKVFHNFLEQPEKPYFFMGYDQWGRSPYDETSRIEQVILLQDNKDKRDRQITETIDRARGKHIWSSVSGLKKDDVQDLDMNDPDQDIFVDGELGKSHEFVPGEQPQVAMIQNSNEIRSHIFGKLGVNGVVRGEASSDVATTNQLSREASFTRVDDIVEETINPAANWMARWAMQFMYLRYTVDHFKKVLGKDGQVVFERVNRDLMEDGMEVSISASGVDKLKAEQKAMDMAKLKMTDPKRFFKDINASDPVGRAVDLMLFLTQPAVYLQQMMTEAGMDTSQMVQGMGQQLNGQPSASAAQDIMMIQSGQVPPVPPTMDQTYAEAIAAFISSPQFEQAIMEAQDPNFKPAILEWAQAVQQMIEGMGQAPAQSAPVAPGQPPAPSGQPVGPVTANPQPGNTAQVNALPPVGV